MDLTVTVDVRDWRDVPIDEAQRKLILTAIFAEMSTAALKVAEETDIVVKVDTFDLED